MTICVCRMSSVCGVSIDAVPYKKFSPEWNFAQKSNRFPLRFVLGYLSSDNKTFCVYVAKYRERRTPDIHTVNGDIIVHSMDICR
jgi:hypothetical protein